MRARSIANLFLAMAALAALAAGARPASAGAGGEDAGVVQPVLNSLCVVIGVTACPQLPTVTQVALEMAGLETSPPAYVRGPYRLQLCSVSGNLGPPCSAVAADAVNRVAPSPVGVGDLASLTPVAFTVNKQGQAVPTALGSPSAVAYFYAVTTAAANGEPGALQLFYDIPSLTSASFSTQTPVAEISLPLQILNADGTERLVCGPTGCPKSVATLQISASCGSGSGCLTGQTVFGDFTTPGTPEARGASSVGIAVSATFAASPNSKQAHAIFEVTAPLLVTGPSSPSKCGKAISTPTADFADCGADPAYFGTTPAGASDGIAVGTPTGINQVSGLPTAFTANVLGFTPLFLGMPIGIAPSAVPACPLAGCPTPPLASTYPFCASIATKGTLGPAVAAFFALGTDGTTYVSAPVTPPATVSCPF